MAQLKWNGTDAEIQALRYLKNQGLRFIEKNYRSRMGEIDLIMQENEKLVFIEVKARSSRQFGEGFLGVHWSKQQKIIKTASLYIQRFNMHNTEAVRFDVISFDGIPPVITWIKDAFRL